MYLTRISSHVDLQTLADLLCSKFATSDPYTFRGAVVEVLVNTLQHSDGRMVIDTKKDSITIINYVKDNNLPTFGLGLKIYAGIETRQSDKLFYSTIYPAETAIRELPVEAILLQTS